MKNWEKQQRPAIITAGSAYLDIDAYACCVAMQELLRIKGEEAIAYSAAACNYSVCPSLVEDGQLRQTLPEKYQTEPVKYIIVDVSDPEFIKDFVPLDQVAGVYDHHVGFEEYWTSRIGDKARIEFIGAAATLIYREWKKYDLQAELTQSTAKLLIAAILDNTLNLTSANTTEEDREVFHELCELADVDDTWCAGYFSEVQRSIEADLKSALFNDVKTVRGSDILPAKVAQLCVWDAERIFAKLPEIRQWFSENEDSWMINLIDIHSNCSYFICDDKSHQQKLEHVFEIEFKSGIAKTKWAYLRKEILKKVYSQTR